MTMTCKINGLSRALFARLFEISCNHTKKPEFAISEHHRKDISMLIVYLVAMFVVFVFKSLSAQIAWAFSSEIMINMELFSNLSKHAKKRIQEILIGGTVQTLSQKRPQKRFWANYFSPQFRHYPQQANLLKNNRRSCRYKSTSTSI